MDFAHSPTVLARRARLDAFIEHYVLPYNAAWRSSVQEGGFPEFMEDLKALAKEEGLWNLCLPHLREDEPGTRLSNLEYAPLAESMGRLPWCSEVFNCSAQHLEHTVGAGEIGVDDEPRGDAVAIISTGRWFRKSDWFRSERLCPPKYAVRRIEA